MLKICLVLGESEPQYAYKCYAYKKAYSCMLTVNPLDSLVKFAPQNFSYAKNDEESKNACCHPRKPRQLYQKKLSITFFCKKPKFDHEIVVSDNDNVNF